jgi:putative nucleotidyltransferase with HDIG domain
MTEVDSLEAALAAPASAERAAVVSAIAQRLLAIELDAPHAVRTDAVRGLVLLADHFYRSDRLAQAAQALQAADTLSCDLNPAIRVDVLLRRGEFELLTWDIGAALDHTSAALPIAQAADLQLEQVRVWTNYGMALQAAGLMQQADKRFEHALDLLEGLDEPRLRCNIWALRSQLGFHENEQVLLKALHACQQALHYAYLSPERVRPSMVCTAYCNLAALSLLRTDASATPAYLASAAAQPNLGMRPRWLIAVLEAMYAVRQNNGATQRAALDALLAPDRAPARAYVIETYSVMSAMYTLLADGAHANEALVKLSAERASALWATISEPGALATQPGSAGALAVASMDMLERLAITAELRDDETGRHCYRVGRLAKLLARRAGLAEVDCELIDRAARLHDIGKFAIPDAILLKPGRLNPAEIQLMRTHANIGADLLASRGVESLRLAEQIARAHHEHWNGSGYPAMLAGDAIPLAGRIAAIADVYDALTHVRPYKPAWSHQDSVAYIQSQRGQQFDPHLTDLFIALMNEAASDLAQFVEQQEAAAENSSFVIAGMRLTN